MPSIHETYKKKILREIEGFPENKMPKLYNVFHLLATKIRSETKNSGNRNSLKGLWKGSKISESLFVEAKKTLFPYEYRH